MKRARMLASFVMLVSLGAWAADAPQFRGPNRDGVFADNGLLKQWPENGPTLAWAAKNIGQGFSSATAVKDKIYITGMLEGQQGCLFVLDLNGAVAQKINYGPETPEKQAPGSRSTPTIDGDRLYLLSGLGVLYCIDLAKGENKWQINVLEKFGSKNIMWHMAESVLVEGNRVFCTPGGKDAAVVALDKMTGETVWTTKGLTDMTSYCSPIIANHNGRRILLTETGRNIIGVDAEKGDLLWTYEQKVPWDIHANTPIYNDSLVYFTAGDGRGGGALQMAPDGSSVTLKWADTNLDALHHGAVLLDGYLYGSGTKQLVCLEWATGKLKWATDEIREGATVAADGMLYIYEGPKSGIVSMVKAQPSGYVRTGKFTVTEGTFKHWAHPTIANGRLYIRHGDVLLAYDIAAK
jgi:outer membrane protein assembly factor BamB